VTHLEDPGVAAGPRGEARTDLGEELMGDLAVFDFPLDQPARVQVAPPREGDQLLGKGA
jgi:hypothetical protein